MSFIKNKAGAKVYYNQPEKHKFLKIPGTYFVKSVGFLQTGQPIVTINKNSQPVAMKLPNELSDWVYDAVGMSQLGYRMFPCKTKFGYRSNNSIYAELL